MKETSIEWCDSTFNPWRGCTKVSPGCLNCYAERMVIHRLKGAWGKGAPRTLASERGWKQPLSWDREAALARVAHWPPTVPYERPRVFCASLADWLDDEVDPRWLLRLCGVIRVTPELDWLLLSKRTASFFRRMEAAWKSGIGEADQPTLDWVRAWGMDGRPPANVWVGTSVEDQTRADERIPELLRIPARVRFLSCEPLLGSVDLKLGRNGHALQRTIGEELHWVIVGGESGAKARPMHPYWARSLRDQCVAAGVPFFFKQWGKWAPTLVDLMPGNIYLTQAGEQVEEGDYGYSQSIVMDRVSKGVLGRLLDGREWNEFPAT